MDKVQKPSISEYFTASQLWESCNLLTKTAAAGPDYTALASRA
jgi:hypothetical protein